MIITKYIRMIDLGDYLIPKVLRYHSDCCIQLRELLNENTGIRKTNEISESSVEGTFEWDIWLDDEDYHMDQIAYCPFCGEKIEKLVEVIE